MRNKACEEIKRAQEERARLAAEEKEAFDKACGKKVRKKSEPYSPRCATVALGMAMRGCKQQDIAAALGVAESTITTWKTRHPEFALALNRGKEGAADLLRGTALQLATGTFKHKKKMMFVNKEKGIIDVHEMEETLPPDPGTLKYMLSRVDPEYGDEQNINLHSDGIRVDVRVSEGAE